MEPSYVLAVVLTGMTVVFAGLIILIVFISATGKIFQSLNKSKKEIKTEKPIEQIEEVQEVAETVNDGEIIAAISAAISMMAEADGTVYRIKSVKPVQQKRISSGNAWAMAGLRENTNPF